jgi:hypothetical protein
MRIACWGPFVVIAGVAGFWYGMNRYGEHVVERTIQDLVARGFARTEAAALGPMPLPEENLLTHEAILRELEIRHESQRTRFATSELEEDPFVERKDAPVQDAPVADPRWDLQDLTRFDEMASIRGMIEGVVESGHEDHPNGYRWLSVSDFRGESGIASAKSILNALEPLEERRAAVVQAIRTCRPAMASYRMDDGSRDLLYKLSRIRWYLYEHGIVACAAGERELAFDSFSAAIQCVSRLQTPAVSADASDGAMEHLGDIVRDALMQPRAADWTEEQLVELDRLLGQTESNVATMKYQRMCVTFMMQIWDQVKSGKISRCKRIGWDDWSSGWQWNWPSIRQSMGDAWKGLRPVGFEDLEYAESMEWIARNVEEAGPEPDWNLLFEPFAKELCFTPGDSCKNRFEATFGGAIGFALQFIDIKNEEDLAAFDRAYSEAEVWKGLAWVRMARWAIALERHHKRHGVYPDGLDHLDAEFCQSLPVDPISGKRFGYEKIGMDRYRIKGAKPEWDSKVWLLWEKPER